MTQDGVPMWDDPNESPVVRQLLRAGRADYADYDVEQGLARHLANLQAGTPLPAWAVQSAATQVSRVAVTSILGWLIPPAVGLVALGGWLYFQQTQPTVPTLSKPVAAVAAAETRPQPASVSSVTAEPASVVPREDVVASADTDAVASAESSKRYGRSARVSAARHGGQGRSRSDRGDYRQTSASTRNGGAHPSPDRAVPAASAASGESQATAAKPASAASKPAEAREPSAAAEAKPEQQLASAPQQPNRASTRDNAKADPEADTRLEREMQMLAVAQRMLNEDPERALRLAQQGEQEFPRTMFTAERKQIALLAMVKLGRVDEARKQAKPFLRAYPNAPWSARLREALATGRVAATP